MVSFRPYHCTKPQSLRIGGYIIRSLLKSISCQTCYHALITNQRTFDHNLIVVKDGGGLLYPSEDVLKILRTCETAFKGMVSGDGFRNPKILHKSILKLKLKNTVLRMLPTGLFSDIPCDFNNEIVAEDLYSFQLTKEIINNYTALPRDCDEYLHLYGTVHKHLEQPGFTVFFASYNPFVTSKK